MKINKRFTLVLFLTLTLLVVSVFPAAAEAEIIPITGTCDIFAFAPWNVDHDPDYRYWSKTDGMEHWRNQLILADCEYNDVRLNGILYTYDNWNVFANENGAFISRSHGDGYMSDDAGNDLGLWDLSSVARTNGDGSFTSDIMYKGRGIYKGLTAKVTLTPTVWPNYDVSGVLLVPANK
jgi:hypothetical protein